MSEQAAGHPRLQALIEQAAARGLRGPLPMGVVYPGNVLAMQAAFEARALGIIEPVMIGPRPIIDAAASDAHCSLDGVRIIEADSVEGSAQAAVAAVHSGLVRALMKGSLHTDELMAPVVKRGEGLRGDTRISHLFVFDLPRYHKLLGLADAVVNIHPALAAKQDIVTNAIQALGKLGVHQPKVAVVTAVESVNPAIPATLDAQALVELHAQGQWPQARLEGPFGFDNAISLEAAKIKGMQSEVAGDPDLLIAPDLNAGNMLYKSFIYIGGGECAGVVLGATVPIVLTSRSDSPLARLASIAMAALLVR
jgi:phosphate acetyltransferase/phosphate butyryltransferase